MNIYAWIEYAYYDGLLCFAQVIIQRDPASPVTACSVRWLNSEASA